MLSAQLDLRYLQFISAGILSPYTVYYNATLSPSYCPSHIPSEVAQRQLDTYIALAGTIESVTDVESGVLAYKEGVDFQTYVRSEVTGEYSKQRLNIWDDTLLIALNILGILFAGALATGALYVSIKVRSPSSPLPSRGFERVLFTRVRQRHQSCPPTPAYTPPRMQTVRERWDEEYVKHEKSMKMKELSLNGKKAPVGVGSAKKQKKKASGAMIQQRGIFWYLERELFELLDAQRMKSVNAQIVNPNKKRRRSRKVGAGADASMDGGEGQDAATGGGDVRVLPRSVDLAEALAEPARMSTWQKRMGKMSAVSGTALKQGALVLGLWIICVTLGIAIVAAAIIYEGDSESFVLRTVALIIFSIYLFFGSTELGFHMLEETRWYTARWAIQRTFHSLLALMSWFSLFSIFLVASWMGLGLIINPQRALPFAAGAPLILNGLDVAPVVLPSPPSPLRSLSSVHHLSPTRIVSSLLPSLPHSYSGRHAHGDGRLDCEAAQRLARQRPRGLQQGARGRHQGRPARIDGLGHRQHHRPVAQRRTRTGPRSRRRGGSCRYSERPQLGRVGSVGAPDRRPAEDARGQGQRRRLPSGRREPR